MHKRGGLGRGLGALISPGTSNDTDALIEIPVEEIHPNPNQPRRAFAQAAIDELTTSIRASGVIQPVIVRRVGERYELIAGERRWRAARQAGLSTIPSIVRNTTDAQSLELALVENLLREDLNPLEEAEAYHKLLGDYGWTQDELAERIGRDRSSIANTIRLLKLPEPIQEDLRSARLTMGHARALLSLGTASEQMRLRDQILAHSWSVRATEEGVQRRRAIPKPGRRRSVELAALEDSLQQRLLTRVRITGTERRGRIEIAYATADELDRLAGLLGPRD
jgi:ParB family transcriptional regulator, chromosome partitioning protein